MTATTSKVFDTEHRESPSIRTLANDAPSRWLAKGLEDLKTSKLHSLIYGLVFTLAGLILIWRGSGNPLFTLFILSGFMLVGPLAAVGLYDLSHQIERGEAPSLLKAISALGKNTGKLIGFALVLGMSLLIWAVITGSVVNTFFADSELLNGSRAMMMDSGTSIPLVALFMLSGLVLALIAAAISILSIPIASKKSGDILTASVILIILLLVWSQLAAMVYGLFFDHSELVTGGWGIFYQNAGFIPFIGIFIVCGALLAVFIFTVSVVTIPYISDKNVSVWVAMSTSIRVVLKNPVVMMRWAATLALLILIGMSFFFIGLVFTLPLAGHASWHAYREAVIKK